MAAVGQYLRYATVLDQAANRKVQALAAALVATRPPGVREIYPGYGSVYVEWDDDVIPTHAATGWIDRALAQEAAALPAPRLVEVPVAYGGLDTDDVAARTGLPPEEIARIHAGAEYRFCASATAGQPLLGGTDPRLELPRRESPRTDVPARSVAITGRLATVYPLLLPGGWHVIGTALVNVYDPMLDDPFLVHLGDRVRFVPATGAPPPLPTVRELLPAEPRLPALAVVDAGAFDLVLDAGRLNQAHHGMAQSGPLDAPAARLANRLCGNAPGAPLLESTLTGPTLRALRDVVVGAAGAGLALEVDGEPAGVATTRVRAGSTLRLRPTGKGARGYLAVAGGIESDVVLGSASVDRFGLLGRPLRAGDVLGLAEERVPGARLRAELPAPEAAVVLRLRRGPQWSQAAQDALLAAAFRVTIGDRMGVRLDGPEVPGGELLSESPPPGAVQVPADGAPILLLNDRMRSAGYDKPCVLHPADLARAAQLRTGDAIRFAMDVEPHPVPWYRDLS